MPLRGCTRSPTSFRLASAASLSRCRTVSALEQPEGLITEDLLVRLRDQLVEGVLNALAKYRSDADVAATVDRDDADCEPSADDTTETPAPVTLRKRRLRVETRRSRSTTSAGASRAAGS